MNVHLRVCRTRAAVQNEPHRLRFAARGNCCILIGSILLNCSSLDCLTADVVCSQVMLTQPRDAACGGHYKICEAFASRLAQHTEIPKAHTRHDVYVNNDNCCM